LRNNPARGEPQSGETQKAAGFRSGTARLGRTGISRQQAQMAALD